jgi:hypothetical protein
MPTLWVDVANFAARIRIERDGKYVDVTDEIENGGALAEDAVYSAGGGLNISGWYPPTKEILEAVRKSLK